MNTKKINELPVLQQATAETNVLVEQNGTASRIPASALGGGGGSEKALIDKLAPAFKKTGSVVTCNPIAGRPLEVVSLIAPEPVNPNLISDIDWQWDDEGVMAEGRIPNFPAGTYTIYCTNWVNVISDGKSIAEAGSGYESATFTTTKDGELILQVNSPDEVPSKLEVGDKHTEEYSNPNLIPEEYTSGTSPFPCDEDLGVPVLELELDAGTYTLYHHNHSLNDLDVEFNGGTGTASGYDEPFTFTHNGGTVRLIDSAWPTEDFTIIKLEKGREYTGTNYASGYIMLCLYVNDEQYWVDFGEEVISGSFNWTTGVLTHSDGNTDQYDPQEIIAKEGVNTLSSSTGDTEVTGKADLATAIQDIYNKLFD